MLKINPEKCSGCRRCEVYCSFFHTGYVSSSQARVKVVKIEALGIDYPVLCLQCVERYCAKCPESAITIGAQGQIHIDPSCCTTCGICETLCPIGAIEIHDDLPYLCDMCNGEPQCVAQCNMGAIIYESLPNETLSLEAYKISGSNLNPEEKRMKFAQHQYRILRTQWKEKTES